MKKILLAVTSIALFAAITGCSGSGDSDTDNTQRTDIEKISSIGSTNKPTSNTSNGTQNANSSKTTFNETAIKEFGRNAAGELQKVYFGIDIFQDEKLKQKIQSLIKNKQGQDDFYYFIKSNPTNDIEVKNIAFNQSSERLIENNGSFYYQVTMENEIKYVKYEKESRFDMTFYLKIDKDSNGNFYTDDIQFELGHAVEGAGYQLTSVALDELAKNKVKTYVKNALLFDAKDKEDLVKELSSIYATEEEASAALGNVDANLIGKKEFVKVIFDKSSFGIETEVVETAPDTPYYRVKGKIGVVSTEKGTNKETKKAYTVDALLTQKDPDNENYFFVVKEFKAQDGATFDWNQ